MRHTNGPRRIATSHRWLVAALYAALVCAQGAPLVTLVEMQARSTAGSEDQEEADTDEALVGNSTNSAFPRRPFPDRYATMRCRLGSPEFMSAIAAAGLPGRAADHNGIGSHLRC